MFIARVSRGRTVREFMICVLMIPSPRLRALDDRLRRHRDQPDRQSDGYLAVKAVDRQPTARN
jgi:hypothetical protein